MVSLFVTFTVLSTILHGCVGHQVVTLPGLDTSLKIYEISFLMAHDAATSYLDDDDDFRPLYQNQVADFQQQYNCGVRALDIRICMIDDNLVFRHGKVIIPQVNLTELISDSIEWVNEASSEGIFNATGDVILFYFSSSGSSDDSVCGSYDDNMVKVKEHLSASSIPFYSSQDISDPTKSTLSAVLANSPHNIIAVSDIVQDNFDETLSCNRVNPAVILPSPCNVDQEANDACLISAFQSILGITELAATFLVDDIDLSGPDLCAGEILCNCFSDSNLTKADPSIPLTCEYNGVRLVESCWYDDGPIDALYTHLDDNVDNSPSGALWQQQGLWQGNSFSQLVMTFMGSSLTLDITESRLNQNNTERLFSIAPEKVNIFNTDNSCEDGPEMSIGMRRAGILTYVGDDDHVVAPPPIRPENNSQCLDNPDFVDLMLFTCNEWRCADCDKSFYGPYSKEKLIDNCPLSCGVCGDLDKSFCTSSGAGRSAAVGGTGAKVVVLAAVTVVSLII